MRRLNRNLHADDEAWYRIPDDRELSAQYLLLYELSLPYGLDLNDRINIDKSASRVTATLARATTAETRAFFGAVEDWQRDNWPNWMHADPTSAAVMFTYISERNMQNMVGGTIIAVIAISLIMIFALRSVPLGLLSLVPNGLPILATFGAWTLLVGSVGFSVATVASISLGIIVDDTVHLLSKYVRARNERDLSVEDSIRRLPQRRLGNRRQHDRARRRLPGDDDLGFQAERRPGPDDAVRTGFRADIRLPAAARTAAARQARPRSRRGPAAIRPGSRLNNPTFNPDIGEIP
jgi:hypothetical protein